MMWTHGVTLWRTLKFLDGLNYESKGENIIRRKSWGVFPSSQHFEDKGVFWSFGIKTSKIDKQINYSHP